MRYTDEPDSGRWRGPDLERQKAADYTVEDVLTLPDDAPRVELVDGVMQVVPSPTDDHQDITGLVWSWLRRHAPQTLRAHQSLGMRIDDRNSREPDVLLVDAAVPRGSHFYEARHVALAVEVVSPGTRVRDRFEKPTLYANAGVPYYWRVEQHPVHVYAYQLGEDGAYKLVADSAEELVLDEPFPIRLPIREITP